MCIWVEKGMDEYCHLCHECAISYYEDQILDLKCDLIVNEIEEEEEKKENEDWGLICKINSDNFRHIQGSHVSKN